MQKQKTVQRKNNTRRPATTTKRKKTQTLNRASMPKNPQQRKRMQQKKRAMMLRRKRRIFFGGLFAMILAIVLLIFFVKKSIYQGMAKTDTLTLTDKNVVFEEVTSSEGLEKKDVAAFAKDVVSDFNKEAGKKEVRIKKVSEVKDTIYVKTTYENIDVYSAFSGYEAFSGTIASAQEAGYDFSPTFVSVAKGKKGEVTDAKTVCADPSLKVLIIRENATFVVNGTVLFVSDENTSVTAKDTVAVSGESDNASAALTYIIYK